MPATREVIRAWHCSCIRCGYHWWSIAVELPRACAKCKSPLWNTPRRRRPNGAPPLGRPKAKREDPT